MVQENIYQKFFKTYYEDNKEYFLKFYEGPLKFSEENYYELVLQPGRINLDDFVALEKSIKLKFPFEFKRFFGTAYSIDRYFRIPALSLAVAWIEKPFEALNDLIFDQELSGAMLGHSLIPVGIENDNFYVCLDLRDGNSFSDSPIILIDIDSSIIEDELVVKENLHSSFAKFIEHCTNCLLTDVYDYDPTKKAVWTRI